MSLRLLSRRAISSKSLIRLSPSIVNVHITTRFNSTTTTKDTTPIESTKDVDPKIIAIVDQISQLTLLQTSSLISELKVKLDIPDIVMPMAGGMNNGGMNNGNEESGSGENEESAKEEEKTVFNIKLDSFETKSKAKVIKEVKGLLGLSLVEAKKFVEAAPKVLKENVAKEDAEKMKATLEGLGAKVTLE